MEEAVMSIKEKFLYSFSGWSVRCPFTLKIKLSLCVGTTPWRRILCLI